MLGAGDSGSRTAAEAAAAAAHPRARSARCELEWRVAIRSASSATADTEVHRATWVALTPEQRRTPVLSAERALGVTRGRRLVGDAQGAGRAGTRSATAIVCPDGKPYAHPESHRIVARLQDLPDAATIDCTWLTAPRGGGAAAGRRSRSAATSRSRSRCPIPAVREITVEIGGREVAERDVRVTRPADRRHGRQLRSRRGQSRRARALLARARGRLRQRRSREPAAGPSLVGYPARIGNWRQIGDKEFLSENARWLDQACHRSLYSHQLRAALQLVARGPAPRRDLRRRRLLGRGGRDTGCSCATRATSGCRTRRSIRRSRPSPRRSAAATRRRCRTCPRPIT